MITATKILLQPPYSEGFALSYAEANARLAFFLTYFDEVIPIAYNPHAFPGEHILASTELEQEYVLSGAGKMAQLPKTEVDDLNDPGFLNDMAFGLLKLVNANYGGFAIASAESFSPPPVLDPVDRVALILRECLPTPHHDTPLADILAFKREHEAQLRAFHEAVDDLYYGLSARPVDALLPRFKDRMDRHVEQTVRAYETRHIKSYMGVLKIGLKLAPGVIGETIGLLMGVPVVGGLLGGSIGLVAEKTRLPADGNSVPKDFEYIFSGLAAGHTRAFPTEPPMVLDVRGPNLTNCVVGTYYPAVVTPPTRADLSGAHVSSSVHL